MGGEHTSDEKQARIALLSPGYPSQNLRELLGVMFIFLKPPVAFSSFIVLLSQNFLILGLLDLHARKCKLSWSSGIIILTQLSFKMTDVSRLQSVLDEFEITIADANDLVALEGYDIVFIADDSGSMSLSSLPDSEIVQGRPNPSRWDELKKTIDTIIELACCFDEDGVDIYYLNRNAVKGVKSRTDPRFLASMKKGPYGRTPLEERLIEVIKANKDTEKQVLLLIATDGIPSGGIQSFERTLRLIIQADKRFRFQFLACTGNDEDIGWLEDIDEEFEEVDCTDDFITERLQVLNTGKTTRFTRSDWVMKALLGPVSKKFDDWDEPIPSLIVQMDKYSTGLTKGFFTNWKNRSIELDIDGVYWYKNRNSEDLLGCFEYADYPLGHFTVIDDAGNNGTHPAALQDPKAPRQFFAALRVGTESMLVLRSNSQESIKQCCDYMKRGIQLRSTLAAHGIQ